MRKDVKVWLRIHTIFLQCTMIGCYFCILLPLCTSGATTPLQSDSYLISCIPAVQWPKAVFLMIGLVCWPSFYWKFSHPPGISYRSYFAILAMSHISQASLLTVHFLKTHQSTHWNTCSWSHVWTFWKGSAFDYISSITYSYVLCGCPGVMSMEGLAYVHHWIYLLTHSVVKCACATL